jgi:LPS O-antigen subunit length determinant protein (WzzB/FepE family)
MLKPAADKDEWARVVFNRSMMDIDTARERFERQVRFISDPSLPIHPEKPGALTFILGLALLGFFGTAAVLYRKVLVRFLLGDGQDSAAAR